MTVFAGRRILTTVFVLAATLCATATPLAAQSNTGNVYGSVRDEHGSPVRAAEVALTGSAAPRTTRSDSQGLFRFLAVAPDRYTVTASAPGFAAAARGNVVVSVGRNAPVDVTLTVAPVAESATVTGEKPLVDPRRVETGQNFSGRSLTEIPTSRDIWALAQQVPGVQLDTVNVAGNASAVVGGPGLSDKGSGNVAYLVDGATVTDNTYGFGLNRQNGGTNTYYDFGAIQDVEVVTGGASLDQQNSGLTLNVVTKRGTNALKGSARYLYASGSWQSSNTPPDMLDLGLKSNRTRFIREYGGELGGPLWKDRLWLWASAARQDISLSPTTFKEGELPVPQTITLEPWSAKLNAQVSASNASAFYYQRSDRLEDGVGTAPDRPPPTRWNLTIPTNFYKLEDSNAFSADLFASLFLSYQDPRRSDTPVGGLDRDVAYYDDSFRDSFEYFLAHNPQKQANLQASRFFRTGSIGHELKFAFNYRQLIADSASGLPGNQNMGVELVDSEGSLISYAALTRGVRHIYDTEFWTGALGDTLTSGSLTLFLGLRYDLQRARNLPSTSFANRMFAEPCTRCGLGGAGDFPGLPEVKYHGADDWQLRFSSWQPRVSATYALGERKGTLLRASYARFTDQLGFLASFLNGVPAPNGYVYAWVDLNHDHAVSPDEVDFNDFLGYYGDGDPALLPSQPNQVEAGFAMPRTDEITVGVDEQVTDDFAVSGTFSYRRTSNLQFLAPIGAALSAYRYAGRLTGIATASNGFVLPYDVPYFALDLAEPPPGQELVNRPGATQRYFGLDVSLVKRLARDWTVRANFGWNSFHQYLTPRSIQNPNNLWNWGGQNDDGGIATAVSSTQNVWLNAGWQFNVNGLYQGPWGLTFGANLFGRQGYPSPYHVIVHTDFGNENILIDRMDTYRYPDVYQLDLRLQKTFQIGAVAITPVAELFNVANGNTVFDSDSSVGTYVATDGDLALDRNAYFNQTVQIQSPRIVRLSLQVAF